ncbi:MAG: ABC transporter substrate-binding protein [Dehalococcoidia bacterium]
MSKENSFCYKLVALIMVLALLVPVLAACGDDEEETATTPSTTTPVATTPTNTTPSATTPAATAPTPTVSKDPVKIGVLCSWSGPAAQAGQMFATPAISLVEYQLQKAGGILGGRPVKFITYDDGSSVAGTQGGFTKLVMNDKVSAIVMGGAMVSTLSASSELAEKFKVPYFSISTTPPDITDRPYTVRAGYPSGEKVYMQIADFIVEQLKPNKVALLSDDLEDYHRFSAMMKSRLEDAGVKIVYDQFIGTAVTDFSPYITRIKYEEPDVLVRLSSITPNFTNLLKQVKELGGWGQMKFVSTTAAAITDPATIAAAPPSGCYSWGLWAPGMNNPGSKQFEQDFAESGIRGVPRYFAQGYMAIWGAIKAIELAGIDDPEKVAQAARSGHLEWESPAGLLQIDTNGEMNLTGYIFAFKDGQLVLASE